MLEKQAAGQSKDVQCAAKPSQTKNCAKAQAATVLVVHGRDGLRSDQGLPGKQCANSAPGSAAKAKTQLDLRKRAGGQEKKRASPTSKVKAYWQNPQDLAGRVKRKQQKRDKARSPACSRRTRANRPQVQEMCADSNGQSSAGLAGEEARTDTSVPGGQKSTSEPAAARRNPDSWRRAIWSRPGGASGQADALVQDTSHLVGEEVASMAQAGGAETCTECSAQTEKSNAKQTVQRSPNARRTDMKARPKLALSSSMQPNPEKAMLHLRARMLRTVHPCRCVSGQTHRIITPYRDHSPSAILAFWPS